MSTEQVEAIRIVWDALDDFLEIRDIPQLEEAVAALEKAFPLDHEVRQG